MPDQRRGRIAGSGTGASDPWILKLGPRPPFRNARGQFSARQKATVFRVRFIHRRSLKDDLHARLVRNLQDSGIQCELAVGRLRFAGAQDRPSGSQSPS